MAPKLEAIYFPGGASGQVILADGRATALPTKTVPVIGVAPYFIPD